MLHIAKHWANVEFPPSRMAIYIIYRQVLSLMMKFVGDIGSMVKSVGAAIGGSTSLDSSDIIGTISSDSSIFIAHPRREFNFALASSFDGVALQD